MSEHQQSPDDIINSEVAVQHTENIAARDTDAIASTLGSLTLQESSPLREHQIDAFEDIVSFYAEGGRECYAKLPTGTGKTVIFVEITKRLIEQSAEQGRNPRIIVLEPTKDLVDQTVGSIDPETQKRRGFKGFAPDLDVRAIHSDLKEKDRLDNLLEAQVVVTTYNTFRNLTKHLNYASTKSAEEWKSEFIANANEASAQKDRAAELEQERKAFFLQAYYAQESSFLKEKVDDVLYKILSGREQASDADMILLEQITAITSDESLTPEQLFKTLRRFTKGAMTDNIRHGVEAIERTVEQAAETVRLKLEERQKAGNLRTPRPPRIRLSRTDRNKAAEEGLKMSDLSETEKLLTYFIYKHRKNRSPSATELKRFRDSERYRSYTDDILMAKGRVQFLENRNKYVSWLLDLNSKVSDFELIVCDEAHRVIGKQTWQAMQDYARDKDIAVLGLTATDELTDRSLQEYFEEKAHELTKQEAIRQEIVNPMSLYVYNTGLRFNDVSLEAGGDYDGVSFKAMRFNKERNEIGIRLITELIQHGYQGITPCIAGDNGQHAREISKFINQQYVTDPNTGEERYARSKYILDDTPKDRREAYYAAYERGELDWLTYTDVLGEGWDSDAAKALVSLRPTRSTLIATQRLGRIGRTSPDAPVSIAIDLFDGIISKEGKSEIPPVLAADVFEISGGKQGIVVGNDKNIDSSLHETLTAMMPTQEIEAYYTRYLDSLTKLPAVNALGITVRSGESETLKNPREWQTWEAVEKVFNGILPADALEDSGVRKIAGRKGNYIVELFNIEDVKTYMEAKPLVNPWKLYVENDKRWISVEGCTKMLSKILTNSSEDQISSLIKEYEVNHEVRLDSILARKQISFVNPQHPRYGIIRLYDMEQIIDKLVPYITDAQNG